jgi:hypothetical protein
VDRRQKISTGQLSRKKLHKYDEKVQQERQNNKNYIHTVLELNPHQIQLRLSGITVMLNGQ